MSLLKRCPYFRGLFSTLLYVSGTTDSILIREVSLFWMSLKRGSLYIMRVCPIILCVANLVCENTMGFMQDISLVQTRRGGTFP